MNTAGQLSVRNSQHAGMTMKTMVAQHLGPRSTGTNSTPDPSTLSPAESDRNYKITARLNMKNFMGNIFSRFDLPNDGPQSHQQRTNEFWRQAAMPWQSVFMHVETDDKRLNNPAQASFVKQRQLTIPDTYGQFYAFMHALSAAFGTLRAS